MDKLKQTCCYRKNGVSRRVLVIRGNGKTAFEEAIFILRNDAGLSEQAFLQEAERLVSDYVPASAPSAGPQRWLIPALVLLAVTLTALLVLLCIV